MKIARSTQRCRTGHEGSREAGQGKGCRKHEATVQRERGRGKSSYGHRLSEAMAE